MKNERLLFFNKPWVKIPLLWIVFWSIQSVLMSGGKHVDFYLQKNIAIVSLQAIVIYTNIFVLFPYFFNKRKYLLYILFSIVLIYLIFSISFYAIDFVFSFSSIKSIGIGSYFVTDFWRILSGSSFYSLALVCSTLYQLLRINRKLESEREKSQKEASEIQIQIKDGNTSHIVNINDIYFIEGMREYVAWNTKEKRIIALQSLKSIHEQYQSHGLKRVHKSYIVNTHNISSFSNHEIEVANHIIPIGKTYRNNLKM